MDNTTATSGITLVVDPIEEVIEELSALTAIWQKNNDRGRPSPVMRGAIIMAARELIEIVSLVESLSEPEKSQ